MIAEGYSIGQYGLVGDRAASGSRQLAAQSAIFLTGLTGATYPASHDPSLQKLSDEILRHLTEFASNARRDMEIRGLRDVPIEGGRWDTSQIRDLPPRADNVWDAVCRVLHAREMIVLIAKGGRSVFPEMGDASVIGVIIKSDRGGPVLVDVYGLCYAYLER